MTGIVFAMALAAAEAFKDPAPPVIKEAAAAAPAIARPNPAVKVHGKPKALAAGAVTHDWRSFLGPSHNGHSSETKLLRNWPKNGPKLIWEMKKGTGYSSPAIAGDYLVYMHREGSQEKVECLHPETGAKYWEFSYPTQFEDRYGYNNGPRSSPVIDGELVYTYGAEGKLHCLRLKTGQLYWSRNIAAEFKVPQDFFGTATTPLIEGDLLIVNIGAPGGPSVAAFHKASGKMAWGAGKEWGPSYASPVPATVHGKRRMFVFAGGESNPPTGGLYAIDPANGAVDFQFPWRSKSYESVNAASPVVAGNQVFVSASYKAGGALLDISPAMKHAVAWTSAEIGTHFNTAIEKDGYLYAFDGRNEPDASLVSVERKTGKVMWRVTPEWDESFLIQGEPRKQRLGTFRGTLLHVDGHFLALGELGHLLWLELSPKGYKELARAWLFAARETWSLPVLSRGLLYVSQHSRDIVNGTGPRLLCYDLRAEK
ncbi:MAG: PQQ-like beta-propeller repeat protein [Bryobacterales bacterium]|nr:PQQ-like beta-propeller repeat protein [Bryobacterales bacterium]